MADLREGLRSLLNEWALMDSDAEHYALYRRFLALLSDSA